MINQQWNNLPPNIVNASSINDFKKILDEYNNFLLYMIS